MNPFSYGRIVKEPYFFNRRKEMEEIVNTLKGGNNIVLYAPRRYGKTSLVMKVIKDLEKSAYKCVYFDLMPVYSRESFIEGFSKAILKRERNWKTVFKSMAKFIKGLKLKLSFDEKGTPELSLDFVEEKISDNTLETVIDLPENLAKKNKPYIVVMDEFQEIQKLNGDRLEDLLRSRIQHHQKVNYLFLGSKTHLLTDMFTNQNRPFYNSAKIMGMGTLPHEETIEFLRERFLQSDITLDTSTAESLIEKAGKIPYYIQLLASEVWQYAINSFKVIEPAMIEECFNKVLEIKNDFYLEMYEHQTGYQKKLLKALAAEGKNVFAREYALKHRLSTPSTTQKALAGLIDRGIIEKRNDEYVYTDPFFREFILRLSA